MLTALYWWAAFAIVHAGALIAGDRDPSAQPPADVGVMTRSGVTIVIAVLLYAMLSLAWQRFVTPHGWRRTSGRGRTTR